VDVSTDDVAIANVRTSNVVVIVYTIAVLSLIIKLLTGVSIISIIIR